MGLIQKRILKNTAPLALVAVSLLINESHDIEVEPIIELVLQLADHLLTFESNSNFLTKFAVENQSPQIAPSRVDIEVEVVWTSSYVV